MLRTISLALCLVPALFVATGSPPTAFAQPVAAAASGAFENHQDVGTLLRPGVAEFDPAARRYTLSASGQNMWAARDDFHFVWRKASGELALSADVAFVGAGTDPHRKACLMIRQTLDPDSPYVDIALHGDGLTSLQFRELKGGPTHEVQANIKAPRRLRLEKRGSYARMYLAAAAEEADTSFSGAAVRVAFEEPFYVGLGLCAHNKDVIEKAVFSNVELQTTFAAGDRQGIDE